MMTCFLSFFVLDVTVSSDPGISLRGDGMLFKAIAFILRFILFEEPHPFSNLKFVTIAWHRGSIIASSIYPTEVIPDTAALSAALDDDPTCIFCSLT